MPTSKKDTVSPSMSKKVNKSVAASHKAPIIQASHPANGERGSDRMHKRSRQGCFVCRLRRKKCDERFPHCATCVNLGLKGECVYVRPKWWGTPELRAREKEKCKGLIQDKKNERGGNYAGQLHRNPKTSAPPPESRYFDFSRPTFNEPYDLFSSHLPTPGLGHTLYGSYEPPYQIGQIDVKTEQQTFINDVPTRHDYSTSSFSSFVPPQLGTPLPAFTDEEWSGSEYLVDPSSTDGMNTTALGHSTNQTYLWLQNNILVEDNDRSLLDHFIHNVLRQIFPLLEVHQTGHLRAQAILHAMESNKCYLECCLSVAAIHRKTTEGLNSEQIDHDIMRHRFEAINHLCQALNDDVNHQEILDATLAMIFFNSSVGPPVDHLPDISWFDHFQAAANLVNRLGLPTPGQTDSHTTSMFNMTLTSWIDILGATMMGKSPQFAHTYNTKHLSGESSGLRELMGCDDRVMYLISEIACLDSLKNEGRVDDLLVCTHVSALGLQLECTEPADPTLENPFSSTTGSIRPEVLTKTMSHIFRIAARIYLCSLVPGFGRSQPSNQNLVAAVTDALQFIPSGPHGFDRSLVWPLLMTGVFSTPSSTFRSVLAQRVAALGDHADLGSFGRMYRLLRELWRLLDDPLDPQATGDDAHNSSLTSPITKLERSESPSSASATLGGREIKRQQVNWRDVMKRNNWHYLLI
ncbi:C6 finger domain transcription factor nosA [Penicillium riverlandense]|uniref:C6 finger domain transcription factor nosA n=1 Tax=Penicillium riverlandense TaxID=1903569 RepID=UPI002546C76C|nr:C6 finger domain transcription factor nosA [Penicillium riverlandense]KAJ5811932.1 C6 finger domain transcription factor nosA [Penicillium riverlandense]